MPTHEAVEFDHYPEAVENGLGLRRLELLGIKEQLRDPAQRRAFFANLSDHDFTQMLGYINSVTRGQKIDYAYTDGNSPSAMATPPPEDKERLMNQTFQTVRDILANPEFDDHQALRRAGLTVSGAVGFIHPKEDGNGRMGRCGHYLIEFGTERGDQAFTEETYAIIGKTRVYDTDSRVAMYVTPPAALERALNATAATLYPGDWSSLPPKKQATERAAAFLNMMSGSISVPINEDIVRSGGLNADRTVPQRHIPAGTYDGVGLFEAEYLLFSEIPNRLPEDVPVDAHRVMARKPNTEPVFDHIPLEYID